MEKIKNLWNSSVDELLNKVSWPTWDQLRESAVIVLISSIIFAVFLMLLDYGIGFGLDFLYGVTK
jgi:preprotein translocase subunit SecE